MCLLRHSAAVPASTRLEHACLAVGGCSAGDLGTLVLQLALAYMLLGDSLSHAFSTPLT
jgi:hypothetical protein